MVNLGGYMRFEGFFVRQLRTALICLLAGAGAAAAQQAPVALPNAVSTLAGGAASTSAGAACATDPSLTATDAFGDGCPGASAMFSGDLRGGVAVDLLGNVWVADTSNAAIRKIDAHSSIVTLTAGKGKVCAGKTDSNGDGCPQAQTSFSSSPRGIATDPWGNVLIAGYGSDLVEVLCNATSPLCPNTAGNRQVGYMYAVAGCVATTGSAGSGGAGADGGTALPTGTCSTAVAELNQPRGVAADRYGNVYIADTGAARYRVVVGPASFNGVANPLAAVIALNPAYISVTPATAAGNIYGILGGNTSPASGAACVMGSTVNSTDALGDGCPFFVTSTSSSTSSAQGVTVDPEGDAIFTPASDGRVRVLFMGGAQMSQLITLNNPSVTTPVVGSIYSIAGGGTSSVSATPNLGSNTSLDGNIYKVAAASNGDIYVGDNTAVLYLDGTTGYIRKLFTSGAVCAAATDTIGDGCAPGASTFGGSNGLGLALDSSNNLFLADTTDSLVREVAATMLLPTAVQSSSSQNLLLHNSASSSATAIVAAPGVTVGSASCGSVNADNTVDCSVPVTFAPVEPGTRSAEVATSGAAAGTLALSGYAAGAALTVDVPNPTTTSFGGNIKPIAVAVSGSGDVYAIDGNTGNYVRANGDGTVTVLGAGAPAAPATLAVDAAETLYAVGAGSQTVSTLSLNASGSYVAGSIPYTPATSPAAPRAIAVASNGNLYIYDATNQAIYLVPGSGLAPVAPMVVGSGYTAVSGLALDPSGDLFVADSGAQTLYKISASGVQTPAATGITPVSVASDAAGTAYVQDSATEAVLAYPVAGPATTVLTGLTTPTGVAVDGSGIVYSADSAATAITAVERTNVAHDFGTDIAATLSGTLGNAGNVASTAFGQTDAGDFALTAGASNGCNFASTALGYGNACTFSAGFTPTANGTGPVSNVLTLLPAASSIGALTLSGTKSGTVVTTTTTVDTQTPASPVYTPSGTEVSFTVTVTPSSGAAAGNVAVSIDGGAATSYALANNAVVVPLSGLSAGSHTISAMYASQGGIVGSSSPAVSFSIAQATTSVTWAPAASTEPVSQALGTSVLNASASGVPGAFVYTATPSGGSATEVDASTYLPIGTYALAVTFTPTDGTDYSGSTASVGTFTVAQAPTTSVLGATTNLVAADGSGDYTTLADAVAALPTTGGSIYIAPGTYTGQVTIPYPNVSLRGLGGDATKVVLTAGAGALPTPQNGGTSGDEGSSTLNIAKTTVGGTSYIPNNFYAENLSINNTWNTDTSYNPSALVSSSGSCAANTAQLSNSALFNAGTLCYSQALALWTTSDEAVFNNVRLNSLQDTLYAGSQGASGSSYTPSRQYFWKGYISGDVDYIFGDAAMVFDQTEFYTAWHGNSATGTETISAQNKKVANGSSNDYLSGYVLNASTLTSQSPGMTNLYFGRPYGQFSTVILRNAQVDQVNPLGWLEFSGQTNLPTSTYAEFNTIPYSDPQGNTGQGVAGPRETTSIAPQVFTTAAQAAQYAPVTFLGTPVNGSSWDPTAALAAGSNAFVPGGAITAQAGTSVTLLYRPQTPGAGLIPTGTYTIQNNGTTLASGSLDASGSAYFTTFSLPVGANNLTVTYSGDSNFQASSTSTPYVVTITPSAQATATIAITNSATPAYGSPITVSVAVSGASGGSAATGSVMLSVDGGAPQSATLTNGVASFPLSGLSAGNHTLSAVYGGDSNYNRANLLGNVSVAKVPLQVTASDETVADGAAIPPYTETYTGFVNGDTAATALTGTPALTTTPATPTTPGTYVITAAPGTLAAANYSFNFVNGTLTISPAAQAIAVATGDTRTVTEPTIPSVCTTLSAALTSVGGDIPASVDATNTNPDGARIQTALNACTAGQAVELSAGSGGQDGFLTGPLSIPSNVTLLIDPGVTMYGSRNAQDYDTVPGTHTCGTVNSDSATSSCLPLISMTNVQNVGIMGYGKINGRGGDVVLNTFPASYVGQTWWGLSTIANSGGSQQNPRMIQISNAQNVTLYKITLMNSTLFHISTTGGKGVTGMTIWDIKIVTPTSARNTDGIDPGNAQNVTITRSYVSDGDDNVAVGASGTVPSQNISVTNNHFYAGHGESIGSITEAGVNNVLFDSNMLSGNASLDSNSTGIRIKSGDDRGGVVTNIQYSNSCFQNHKSLIQFAPLYDTTAGTMTPNFENILLQNLTFLTTGTVQLTGASNNGTVNPLTITFDNVSFADGFTSSNLSAAPSDTVVSLGPGQVSQDFVTALESFAGSNGVVVNDNRTAASLLPPSCYFVNLAPELTGPHGVSQTVTAGQDATAVVILTPTTAGAAFPTGTVTLTDENGNTTTATLPGTGDTINIPLLGLAAGTHTFTGSYAGDQTYVPTTSGSPYVTFGPYQVIVNAGSLAATTTTLSGVPATATFGTAFTATATVAGATDGTVDFLVNGAVYASAPVASGSAQTTLNLPVGSYTVGAEYTGGTGTAASTSAPIMLAVGAASTTTTLASSATTTTVGVQVQLSATVSSVAGTPTGTVTFAAAVNGGTAATVGSATLTNGVANLSANLPLGTDAVTATFVASGSFAGSSSTPISVTVNPPPVIPLPSVPVVLPYTVSTIAGGSTAANADTSCAGSTDKYGDGCQGTQIAITGSVDLRSVVADPFGNIYFTDASASEVRRISPSGVVTDFAGYVSGTACLPTATTPCAATLVKLNKPRGIFADPAGDIFIAGYSDNKVYEVKVSDGLLYLVAGNGTRPSDPTGNVGDGMPATSANLNQPRGVATDSYGNIYIADTADNRIRQVDTTGNIQTVAGTGVSSSTGDGGPATAATVSNPQGVLVDPSDNLYIADSSRVRVVCNTCVAGSALYNLLVALGVPTPTNGDIYTLAGTGSGSSTFNYTAPALATAVNISPQKLAMDASANLYISDSSGVIWFVDAHTGYIRLIAGNGSGCAASAVGDGCPGPQAVFGEGSGGGIGVGIDEQGNVYVSDTLNASIRKISTDLSFPATATGASTAQTIVLHTIPGDTLGSTLPLTSPDYTLSAPACVTNADTTQDCSLTATFTPVAAGLRTAALNVTTAGSNSAQFGLTGIGNGAGATLDPAATQTIGAKLTPAAVAVDGSGNLLVADTASKQLLRFTAGTSGASATGTTLASVSNPVALTTDSRGYAYVADASGSVTQISPAGTAVSFGTFKSPAGVATDSLNNLYVSDSSTASVYEVSSNGGAQRTLISTGLTSPGALAIDAAGNLYVADSGSIFKYSQDALATAAPNPTTVSTAVAQIGGLAVDPAGNLIAGNTAANTIVAIPSSANTAPFVIATGITPTAVALDGAGDVFTGNGSGSVLELLRTQGAGTFNGSASTPQSFTLLSTGNQPLTVDSVMGTDSTDFTLVAASSGDCSVTGGAPTSVVVGGGCTLAAAYAPTSATNTTDVVSFNGTIPNTSLGTPPNALQLTLTGMNAPTATTLMISAPTPAAPTVGQAVSFTATVAATGGTPVGSVTFTVDNTAQTPVLVSGTTAMISLTGLAAGSHTVTASFASTNGFASSTATEVTFTVMATPSLALAIKPAVTNGGELQGTSLTFTATLTGASTPTGTVSFYDGTTLLAGKVSLNSSGVASYTTSALGIGAHSITAQFAGDTQNAPATSSSAIAFTTASAVSAGFTTSTPSVTLQASAGQSPSTYLTYTPNPGYAGTIQFSCTGQPANVTCSFAPASLAFTAASSASQNTLLTVTATSSTASLGRYSGGRAPLFYYAMLLPGLFGIWRLRKRLHLAGASFALIFLLGGFLVAISGCGSSSSSQPSTSTFHVVATDGTNTVQTTVTLTLR